MVQIKVKRLAAAAVMPSKAHPTDAGFDLYVSKIIENDDKKVIYGTDIALEIPPGYVGLVFPRSSIRNYDIRLTNSVGVIDADYRGEIQISFTKINSIFSKRYMIGDKAAQLVIMPVPQTELVETDSLGETARGTGGHGSTGV